MVCRTNALYSSACIIQTRQEPKEDIMFVNERQCGSEQRKKNSYSDFIIAPHHAKWSFFIAKHSFHNNQ